MNTKRHRFPVPFKLTKKPRESTSRTLFSACTQCRTGHHAPGKINPVAVPGRWRCVHGLRDSLRSSLIGREAAHRDPFGCSPRVVCGKSCPVRVLPFSGKLGNGSLGVGPFGMTPFDCLVLFLAAAVTIGGIFLQFCIAPNTQHPASPPFVSQQRTYGLIVMI